MDYDFTPVFGNRNTQRLDGATHSSPVINRRLQAAPLRLLAVSTISNLVDDERGVGKMPGNAWLVSLNY